MSHFFEPFKRMRTLHDKEISPSAGLLRARLYGLEQCAAGEAGALPISGRSEDAAVQHVRGHRGDLGRLPFDPKAEEDMDQ
jgi:hypothetical protein